MTLKFPHVSTGAHLQHITPLAYDYDVSAQHLRLDHSETPMTGRRPVAFAPSDCHLKKSRNIKTQHIACTCSPRCGHNLIASMPSVFSPLGGRGHTSLLCPKSQFGNRGADFTVVIIICQINVRITTLYHSRVQSHHTSHYHRHRSHHHHHNCHQRTTLLLYYP